ncbi:MAG: Bacterial membrane flanked domain protein [Chloroflexi bacterium OLB15]|nr:MAG: Bacterial membrane flanked domain protein [Chloroflexi bacterium OLB15]
MSASSGNNPATTPPPASPTPIRPPQPSGSMPPAEQTLHIFRESKWRFMFWIKSIISLSLWYWSVYRHNYIALTTEKVIQRRGSWISHNETAIYIRDIRDVTTNSSIWGKIFNYGDIILSSSGGMGAEIKAIGLAGADTARQLVFDLRDGRLDDPKLQAMLAKNSPNDSED